MADRYANHTSGLDSPAGQAFTITPHDTNEFALSTRGIYIAGAGNVVAILVGDTAAVTFTAVPAGSILPIRAKTVTTASTATGMVGLA